MEYDLYDSKHPVFQVDSAIVKQAYTSLDNYLIINSPNNEDSKICAIYFSGHSIYFPNNEPSFKQNIINKNRFEWYGIRVKGACKHIYLRDIHKQWYLSGINSKINSPEKLCDFLIAETKGYKVICIGSSAGGYAALLFGSILGATVYAFSPRIEMLSLDRYSSPEKAPLYFRLKGTSLKQYMDIVPFLKASTTPMYCFYPTKSQLDKIQLSHLNNVSTDNIPNVHIIKFSTTKHGVPFPKEALGDIVSSQNIDLNRFKRKVNNPIIFSIRIIGVKRTILGIYKQLKKYYSNKRIQH